MRLVPARRQPKERAYGGKVGVWVKKKRVRLGSTTGNVEHCAPPFLPSATTTDKNSSLDLNAIPHVMATDSSGGSSGSEAEDENWGNAQDDRRTSTSSTNTAVDLVGWDDVLCRPIYRSIGGNGMDNEENESEVVCGGTATDDDSNPKVLHEAKSNRDFVGKADGTHKITRSYATRKRGRNGLSAAASIVLSNCGTSTELGNNTNANATSGPNSKEQSSQMQDDLSRTKRRRIRANRRANVGSLLSPQPDSSSSDHRKAVVRNSFELMSPHPTLTGQSICSMLDSDIKKTPVNKPVKENVGVARDHGNDIKREAEPHALPARRQIWKSDADLTEMDFDECDPVPVPQQMSSSTSLEAAKAFFERLDSTQDLAFNDERSPPVPGKGCVRTTRGTNVSCPKLKEEYVEYCRATSGCGVDPIPIREYAANRGTHFRKSDMFDGLLDG